MDSSITIAATGGGGGGGGGSVLASGVMRMLSAATSATESTGLTSSLDGACIQLSFVKASSSASGVPQSGTVVWADTTSATAGEFTVYTNQASGVLNVGLWVAWAVVSLAPPA